MTDKKTKDEAICDIKNYKNKICRICLSFTDLLLPIFDGEGAEQDLDSKIQKYLPIKISVTDSLPQQLCYQCADALVSWDSLVAISLESDKKLKYLLGMKAPGNECSKEQPEEQSSVNQSIKTESIVRVIDVACDSSPCELDAPIESIGCKKNDPSKKFKRKQASDEANPKDNSPDLVLTSTPEIKTEILDFTDDQARVDLAEKCSEKDLQEGEIFKCQFCHKLFKGKRYLVRHIKLAHGGSTPLDSLYQPQKCNMCPNVYKTKTNLDRHYKKEHLNNQVECPACHTSVHNRKLDFHLKSVHGVKSEGEKHGKFKCKFCEKWFKNKYVRNAHVKEIHLSEPVKCKLCDFQGVRTVLRRHRTEVHAEKKFPCSMCNGAFKTLHTLKMHMTCHSDLRSFTCDICGMGFKRLNNVRDHMKCHQQKSNQCQICGNFFARKRYLAIHEKTIHNFYADGVIPEEKGFECGICGAKLKWKKNLLAHMRIHTGEKPYVCKICKKDFICHGSLRNHMTKHGVCAIKENNILSSTADGIQDPQTNHSIGISIFSHFSIQ